ncbi:hypothetical protein [Fimbriiglobus ruber]|uniref:Uncharacterized protein n=1 Tax=Fimbriiglobus ruber TaxID=1908690 RepID=A0A225DES8_9BACT|nr:hypothetical protein [Fimbriiglobus ruber]OWK38154.1 hypothetical protein FRUB_07274 [Fimbriiglobus ruber]
MKRLIASGVVVVAAIGLLALASYWTTSIHWDGGFPSGEFRLKVRTPEGKPVKGAALRVFRKNTREPAYKYPLENHMTERDLVSDETGRITAIREHGGLQFGGHAWQLFWVIPMGVQTGPRYDCEITAEGFQPLTFEVWQLFETGYESYKDFPKTTRVVDGKPTEFKVYEQTFALSR